MQENKLLEEQCAGCTVRRMHSAQDAQCAGCTVRRMHSAQDAQCAGCTMLAGTNFAGAPISFVFCYSFFLVYDIKR